MRAKTQRAWTMAKPGLAVWVGNIHAQKDSYGRTKRGSDGSRREADRHGEVPAQARFGYMALVSQLF